VLSSDLAAASNMTERDIDLINVVRCSNSAEEVLFPNPLETDLRLVSRSAFDPDGMHEHTGPTFVVAQDQSLVLIIRKTTYCISARRQRLGIDHKLERQGYLNLASNLRLGGRAHPQKPNQCEQNARVFPFHNFCF